jgi:hypothetical protein
MAFSSFHWTEIEQLRIHTFLPLIALLLGPHQINGHLCYGFFRSPPYFENIPSA